MLTERYVVAGVIGRAVFSVEYDGSPDDRRSCHSDLSEARLREAE